MKNNLATSSLFPQEFGDCISDSFSTELPNSSPASGKENDLFFAQSLNLDDLDSISSQSKKIRKKRTAYQRIDDDIRIELWEAVRHKGESLKAAAKRLNINYSSAKSIFYTFRKEGRILKKNAFEKSIRGCNFEMGPIEFLPNNGSALLPLPLQNFNGNHNYINKTPFSEIYPKREHQEPIIPNLYDNEPTSPMHGLVENFNHLVLHNQIPKENEIPKLKIPSFPTNLKNAFSFNEIAPYYSPNHSQIAQKPVLSLAPAQIPPNPLNNPLEKLKQLDNFYMNYSNSPLSGGANFMKDYSNPGSRSICQNEFDSFSDMVNALQIRPSDDQNLRIPKPMRFNATPKNEKMDGHHNRGEGMDWNGSVENAAIDTFKTFMGAHVLFNDAMKKVSYLNNLVQIQKSGVSPTFHPK